METTTATLDDVVSGGDSNKDVTKDDCTEDGNRKVCKLGNDVEIISAMLDATVVTGSSGVGMVEVIELNWN